MASKPTNRNTGSELSSLAPMLGQLMAQQAAIEQQSRETDYLFQIERAPIDIPMLGQLSRDQTNLDRQEAIRFLGEEGGAAWDAFLKGSPQVAQSLEGLSAMSRATGLTPELTSELDRQALDQLRLGGALSAEEERAVQQASRGAATARGMAYGLPAAVQEVMDRQSFADARLRERQNFAASREGANRQFVLSEAALQDQVNPVMRILGLPSSATQTTGQMLGAVGGAEGSSLGGTLQAVLGYGSDVASSNFNAAWSDYLGEQNMLYGQQQANAQIAASKSAGNQALLGAGIGAAGAIAGAGLIAF